MEKFLARQPIFNHSRVVYGYELLFRSGPENYFEHSHPDGACASVADNLFLFGLEKLTQGRRAFINCTRDFIVRDYLSVLPKDLVVLEVLENIQLDDQVIAACRRLKQEGYLIALDDFVESPAWRPLMDLADFIKVDVLAASQAEQLRLARSFARTSTQLIAEKVETYDDFQRTLDWGYSYFQGYFFARPQILTHHDVPASKLSYLRILQAAYRPHIDMEEIADRIKGEASLAYRLLRYLNSAAFSLRGEVRSIPHSLGLLGERGARKWISLIAVSCMADGKPDELIVVPLIRARFCELLARLAGLAGSASDLFLLGMLSTIDAILDMSMQDVLQEISVGKEIREALLGVKNPLRDVFEIALFYERGDWQELDRAADRLGLNRETIPDLFLGSVEWAKKLMSGEVLATSET